jgi:mannose-6-phosphate isomerase
LCQSFLTSLPRHPPLFNTGEAVFLAANEPHAYLSGDLAECMACSDNVIRSGLTPKFKDIDLLCSCLTYNTGRAPIDKGDQMDAYTKLYTPPIPEFQLMNTNLPANTSYVMPANQTPMLTIVIEGTGTVNGTALRKGSIYCATPGTDVALQSGEEGITVYSARCNEDYVRPVPNKKPKL